MLTGASLTAIALSSARVEAATIIEDWARVRPEPAPELKPVTIDTKNTALLVMDLVKGSCNEERRPRCIASIPVIAKLMNEARAAGAAVINTVAGSSKAADILPDVAPKFGEVVLSGTVADKFVRTDLEKMLKDRSITTVITVGTAAQGAVLYTASEAAFRGFRVIVPVDGASSESLYAEQAVAWLLTHAPGVAQHVTLTRADIVKF
ncbi:MAG TPA: isochorismatase family cysteine hydrolase [Xanthobacteraceae bacterium]